jgi:hypothetical protein
MSAVSVSPAGHIDELAFLHDRPDSAQGLAFQSVSLRRSMFLPASSTTPPHSKF